MTEFVYWTCHAGWMIDWLVCKLTGSPRQELWQTEDLYQYQYRKHIDQMWELKNLFLSSDLHAKSEKLYKLSLSLFLSCSRVLINTSAVSETYLLKKKTIFNFSLVFFPEKRRGTMWEVWQDDHSKSLLPCSHVVNKNYWRFLECNILALSSRIPQLACLKVCLPDFTIIDSFQLKTKAAAAQTYTGKRKRVNVYLFHMHAN